MVRILAVTRENGGEMEVAGENMVVISVKLRALEFSMYVQIPIYE
jgi:hypothetical protein